MALKDLAKKLGFENKKNLIFLGAAEAEAEALSTSSLSLRSVYEDFHNLFHELDNEKFIVLGRKGSGKSAFAEYLCAISKDEPNIFCKFIRQGEANLEQIVQIGQKSGNTIERDSLYKWIVLTNILQLFADNQAIKNNKDYSLLSQFLRKNSGYINIKGDQIKELVETNGFEISVEYFKRFMKGKFKKELTIHREKAPFYKLLPDLEDVVLRVLTSPEERANDNTYFLLFDDLDISFNSHDPNSIDSIISLIRVTKTINNELFAKNNLKSKAILFIRDDIGKLISTCATDTGKVFSSYSTLINWYQDEYNQNNKETDLHIREFINKRIKIALERNGLPVDQSDPWLSLVQEPFAEAANSPKTSFKYLLDHTFLRPRDLILLFKPLSTHEYRIPLSKHDANHLLGMYADELVTEFKNELSCFYNNVQIISIMSALGSIERVCRTSSNYSCSVTEAKVRINEYCKDMNADELIVDLFNRSILGNINPNNNHIYFKFREPSRDTYNFNEDYNLIVHSIFRVYLNNKGYS
ncbi:P-loop ATPase, Sll1717 family [Methylotenera mobilis]|uniref:P-loop ATPase, Sll1717 family n=1 Tax=Methylotenera mobilis TaxID=359408 RepID=UPI000375CD61|nr:hypothetical protein [Methylotenera mobilis]